MIRWTVVDGDTVGILGKWKIFQIHWDALKAKDEIYPYLLHCRLPGFKRDLGKFEKVIKAQEFADKAIKIWIKGTGLEVKDE